MAGADPITDMARRLCRRFPDHPARSLARRLVEECNGAITLEAARSRISRQFGQCRWKGGRNTKPAVARKARKPGQGVEMPRSIAEPFTPHKLKVTGTVGIISDLHVPYHDDTAVTTAVRYLQGVGIDGLVILGDLCDFYSISRWVKDPKQRDFKREMADCRVMLKWLRQEFPDIPMVLKQGNHEERYDHWLWQHAAELADEPACSLPQMLRLHELDVEYVSEKRPVLVGKLPLLHGHELQRGISAPVNQARGAFLRTGHTVLVGHGHRTSVHCEPDMFGRETTTWSIGCLSDLNPEYSRFAKYNHGFATVSVDSRGQFDVENIRINHGEIRTS